MDETGTTKESVDRIISKAHAGKEDKSWLQENKTMDQEDQEVQSIWTSGIRKTTLHRGYFTP